MIVFMVVFIVVSIDFFIVVFIVIFYKLIYFQFQHDEHGYGWVTATHEMFKDTIHARYFERAMYNRRASQYIGYTVIL